MKRKNKPGQGRKKGEPYESITFRMSKEKKRQLREKYGKELNYMFKAWIDEILYPDFQ